MAFPAARLGDTTVTGDPITGPCVANVLIEGRPAAVLGDTVSGGACVGAIVQGSATVTIGGRPAARVKDQVAGANPSSGAPVSTVIGPPCATTVQIGG